MANTARSLTVTVLLTTAEGLLLAGSAIAINAATSNPPAWPQFLIWVPTSPVWGMTTLIAASLLLGAFIAVRQARDPEKAGTTVATTGERPVKATPTARHWSQPGPPLPLRGSFSFSIRGVLFWAAIASLIYLIAFHPRIAVQFAIVIQTELQAIGTWLHDLVAG